MHPRRIPRAGIDRPEALLNLDLPTNLPKGFMKAFDPVAAATSPQAGNAFFGSQCEGNQEQSAHFFHIDAMFRFDRHP
jgi:hypothetical protein